MMIVQPKIFGFICTTAHPLGCFKNVEEQVNYIKKEGQFTGIKNVLVIGASTGYGLASRIAAAFGSQAKTIGIIFEKPADEKRTASPGWYNTASFEEIAHEHGIYAKTINGDAFSKEVKQQAADLIRNDLKSVDLVVYSLASPRRTHPITGEVFNSVLKPIGRPFTSKTLDPFKGVVKEVTLEPATEAEINQTIAVMGGEDWEMWIDFLREENLLSEGAITVAYSYIGPPVSHAIYKDGTIGKAKEHLQQTAHKLNQKLEKINGKALVSVNKAVVTQASSAIPVIPLYMSMLLKIMHEQGSDESCIEQINRLFKEQLYSGAPLHLDDEGRTRLDDRELTDKVQGEINRAWSQIATENINQLADVQKYRDEFMRLFGFANRSIDYNAEITQFIPIKSLTQSENKTENYQPVIKLIETEEQQREIAELRYKVYQEILKINHPYMNHETKQFKNDEDANLLHTFGAYINEKLIGMIRGTLYHKISGQQTTSLLAEYRSLGRDILSYNTASLDNSAEISGFIVLPEYQKYGVAPLLMGEIIQLGIRLNPNLQFVFIETYAHLVKYYQFFHFRPIMQPVFNKKYGCEKFIMCLHIDDLIDKSHAIQKQLKFKL
ncbi:enoyl-ACP reductase FabV [Legionella fallonii]|uniref:Enoyl-[acyl-carrier-protein] reductase [NADH] n=1 Tax=Legionella fallonii LLAP-10 TaxID=1212491 RepID=A0A098G1G8_9GAMM|nr:enoyl-ACP reductase FabV [Legionella fallonii]CEG56333.1 Trans-2-enoyl-CoA reductase (NAD(+)) [Legionella fallonii LLAP-10]